MTSILAFIVVLIMGFAPAVSNAPTTFFVLPQSERVGQLFIIGFYGTEVTPALATTLRELRPGGVLLLGRNIKDAQQLTRLTRDLQTIATEGRRPPLWIAIDQEGGIVSRVRWTKHPEPLSHVQPTDAFFLGQRRAEELHALGVTMNLAPVLDSRDPNDFLYPRALHGDEMRVRNIAELYINGHRSRGVMTVPKHFPGYDGIPHNPELTTIPQVQKAPDVAFFRMIVHPERTPIVMASHVIYNDLDPGLPYPLSPKGIAWFKASLGDAILLMSDDLLSPAMQKFDFVPHLAQASVTSGVDIFLLGDPRQAPHFIDAFIDRLAHEPEHRVRFNATINRILELKQSGGAGSRDSR